MQLATSLVPEYRFMVSPVGTKPTQASNARQLWRDLDDLMKRDDNSANIHTSAAEAVHQADKFLSFFEGKVESVRKETENAPQRNFEASSFEGKFANFQQTTPGEVV